MLDELARLAGTTPLDAERGGKVECAYLLVVEQGSSSVFALPDPSIVTCGRAADAELRLDHSSVSRRHARIVVDRGEIRISDLDSHNGTRVNGQVLTGGRALTSGDVISIGEVILVVHARQRRDVEHAILDEPTWRRRLVEEVERAVTYERPLAILSIAGAGKELASPLRTIDVVGRDDDGLLALLPEADADETQLLAQALVLASPAVRVGVATCPSDATDPDNLVLAARAAAKIAPAGGVRHATDTVERRRFGDREVLVGHPAMARVYDLLARLASSVLPILILGETGVGKENAAYAVHHYSPRNDKPFVVLNCAALPESLVESELFGHAKGAFTGAVNMRTGVFEAADGGTLFLDEIGELPLAIQAKLLRAIETRRITRVGEVREREVDIRIVAATNRILDQEVDAGRFRQDLYFRIGAARVHLLPLRDRRCEIPFLFRELVARAARRLGREAPVPTPDVMQRLLAHAWPGNVRELKHVADLVVATVEDDRIEASDLPPDLGVTRRVVASAATAASALPTPAVGAPMRRLADEIEALERTRMTEALAATDGVKVRAAAMLGMPIRTFSMKCRQYGL